MESAEARLTEREVEAFREDGFLIGPRIFNDKELEDAVAAQDEFYGDVTKGWCFKRVAPVGWKPSDPPELRKNDFVSLRVPALKALVMHPALGKMAAQLAGEGVRLWQDQLSYKAPSDDRSKTIMGWHNDRQYWKSCSSERMLTAWIPLEDVSADMGPISYIRGSHLWDEIRGLDFFSTDQQKLERMIRAEHPAFEMIPAVLQKGRVAFHHCRTLHGSGPNTSTRPRRALAVHMQPESNRPVPGYFHLVKILEAELGGRDYRHPEIFPVLGRARP